MAVIYDRKDEGTHPISREPWWQESVAFQWVDPSTGAGGVHRIGHEPNAGDGEVALQCFLFDGNGTRFRRNERVPLALERSERGFHGGGTDWFTSETDAPRISIREPGVELDLALEDFYDLTDFFPTEGLLVEEFAKHHYEVSGRVTGTLVLDGRETKVDGLFHRDHSWGVRKWDSLLSHRWVAGSFGPHLSFGSVVWHAIDDSSVTAGYVVRDGVLTIAEHVDVLTYLEADGLSPRGGVVTWTLPGEEPLVVECEVLASVMADNHEATWVDAQCIARHKGEVGACDFEISNNARAGARKVRFSMGAMIDDGLVSA